MEIPAGDISEELNKQFDDYDGSESPKGSKLVDRFPFLKGTSPDVATVFREALEDDDTPSEPRRQEEVCICT
jgi:hypothetical protein